MSLAEYVDSPWKNSHPAYESSAFNIRPAPEFATAEVILASLYREVGFPDHSESDVPVAGRHFDKATLSSKAKNQKAGHVSNDTWRTVLHGVLESPKQPKQSSKRFLQLSPLVPDCALYSGSARLAGNPWHPGALVRRIVHFGAATDDEAIRVWRNLFDSLSVTSGDDVWARWLQEEFQHRRLSNLKVEWQHDPLRKLLENIPPADRASLRHPAKQFVVDLQAVIEAKPSMTRRQWLSLLDAILRLGTVAHVLWLCDVNARLWRTLLAVVKGEASASLDETEIQNRILCGSSTYLSYGNTAMPTVRDFASGYLISRLGMNLLLWHLAEIGVPINELRSSTDVVRLLHVVSEHRQSVLDRDFLPAYYNLQGEEAKTISCKKGIGSNMVEFARHVLGQRETANETLRGYDQSYFLKRRGEARNSPWVLSIGPVALLAVVHCCLREVSGPRSVHRLTRHLGAYGVDVDVDDINSSDLGRSLRMLGLVLDSPDAETGMLLVPPFGGGNSRVAQ